MTRVALATLAVLATTPAARAQDIEPPHVLRAGASAVDITPTRFPVRQNGGFLEASAQKALAPLHARALVLESGDVTLAIVVVDSCMLPRLLCDKAKALAAEATGLRRDHMLIAATHTHSAPSAMDFCLGSRAAPEYTENLPAAIARAVTHAHSRLAPAEVGHSVVDAPEHTHCRRWIRRPDRIGNDPFGERTVRAMMHPGYQNPDYIGPAGPVDSGLSLLAVRHADGRPLALLANYSMHYFGVGGGLSPDFFGLFSQRFEEHVAPDDSEFVAMLSQGTSGDLHWMDYGKPQRRIDIDTYTSGLVELATETHKAIRYDTSSVDILERRLTISRRRPDAARLEWARQILPDRSQRPRNRPEVYAEQAFFIEANPTVEVVLQTLRIGDLGITAIPCEVYGITGLELKTRSPLQPTFNMELANGAAGYIPPPAQHRLGGYTTWPARTAGLEENAEPTIVETLLGLLEEVSGTRRRSPPERLGEYAQTVLRDRPKGYWRLEEYRSQPRAVNHSEGSDAAEPRARIVGDVAYHLPGLATLAFSTAFPSHSLHLAGGHVVIEPPADAETSIPRQHTISFWFWNGLRSDVRPVVGSLLKYGGLEVRLLPHTNGTSRLAAGTARGKTEIPIRTWQHLAVTLSPSDGNTSAATPTDSSALLVHVFLNGRPELTAPNVLVNANATNVAVRFLVGGGANSLEGRVDELAYFDRALTPHRVAAHFSSAGVTNTTKTATNGATTEVEPQPQPLSPEETLRATQVRDGFRAELVAAEPQIADPVAIDWDSSGRLWVAEMADYPLGLEKPASNAPRNGSGGGRVRWLEDRDGDGRYEHSVLFAEHLNFPTGILVWRGGVLVTAAPDIWYLEDTDGDGRADRQEKLYSGFLPGNQQLRVNGLRWGLDNWVYCASGAHHAGYGADRRVRSLRRQHEVALGSRDFRMQPDQGLLEPQSGPSQFGRVRDDWGHWFGVQNSRPLWHYVLDDRYSRRNPHVASPDPRHLVRGQSPTLYPAKSPQKRYHSFADATRFTSACGPSIYRDSLLFPRDGRTHAFTCDPFHGLVQHAILTPQGATFSAEVDTVEGGFDFFASRDRWCRPVMTRTGPDGALWIVDMYRYIIEHPEWLPPAGRDELRPFFRSGDDRGRIYRIVPETLPPSNHSQPTSDDPTQSLAYELLSLNGPKRDLAQRQLVQDHPPEAVARAMNQLLEMTNSPLTYVHVLGTLAGVGHLTPEHVIAALKQGEPRVARVALRWAETLEVSPGIVAAAILWIDSDDKPVRLQLAQTLGAWATPEAGAALGRLAVRDGDDHWMRAAVASSAVPHLEVLAETLAETFAETASPAVATGVDGKVRHYATGHYARMLLETALGEGKLNVIALVLESLLHTEPKPANTREPNQTWRLLALATFLDALSAKGSSVAKLAIDEPTMAPLVDGVATTVRQARALVEAPETSAELRAAATRLLGRVPSVRDEDVRRLHDLLRTDVPATVQRAAIVRQRDLNADPKPLLQAWGTLIPEVRSAAVAAVLSRGNWSRALLEAIDEGVVSRSTIAAVDRQRLTAHRDRAIAEKAREVFRATGASRSDVLASFTPATRLNGRAAGGRQIFEKLCASCHSFDGLGTSIGPDLGTLTDRSSDALLTAILQPNASVEPRYVAYTAVLSSGETLHGLVTGETGNSILFRLADGSKKTLLRDDIRQLQSSELSFMPEGLEEGLTLGEVADLLAFLQTR